MRSQKTVPAKNSEAIFWRPRFTWPLRAGKRANAHFACSEGFFLSGVPRHMAGWPLFRSLPLSGLLAFVTGACLPVLRCSHGFSLLFFHLFLPNFFLSNFFSFVAQAATGLYFLPKRK